MIVDRFTRIEELASVRSRWAELYAADSAANFFVSWDWISGCIVSEASQWLVLAVRDGDGPYLAFLPLRFDRFPRVGPTVSRELYLGISERGDFTGMVGAPREEGRFIPAFAREIATLPWDMFALKNCADSRGAALVDQLTSNDFRAVTAEATACPFITLPATWDAYLTSRGSSTRRTIRTHLRRMETLPGYRLEFPGPNEAEEAIETLLRIHSQRWNEDVRVWRRRFGQLLLRCYAASRFGVAAMYQGQAVIAAQGFFIERERRTIVAYMIAHSPEYAKYSPGTMLSCASIRHAIEGGYELYNFSQGAQPYKVSLATDVEQMSNVTLWRRSLRVSAIDAGRRGVGAAKRLVRAVIARRE